MPLTDTVLAKASSVADAAEGQSDHLIEPLLAYQRIIDDLQEVYRAALRAGDPKTLPAEAIKMHAALDAWWGTLSSCLKETGLFSSRYHAGKVRIYELGQLFHFRKASLSSDGQWPSKIMDTSLLSCANSIKHYLDSFLALDITLYYALPSEEWFRLVIAFFILYKLSAGSRDIPQWDFQWCRSVIDLEAYLTMVARRIRSTRSSLDYEPRDELYFVLPLILESARDSYVLSRDAPILVGPDHRVHFDLSQSRRSQSTSAHSLAFRCPATGFWVDKALAVDHESNWHDVAVSQSLHPAKQLAKNDELWHGLLNPETVSD